jgi:hypothetical protein
MTLLIAAREGTGQYFSIYHKYRTKSWNEGMSSHILQLGWLIEAAGGKHESYRYYLESRLTLPAWESIGNDEYLEVKLYVPGGPFFHLAV